MYAGHILILRCLSTASEVTLCYLVFDQGRTSGNQEQVRMSSPTTRSEQQGCLMHSSASCIACRQVYCPSKLSKRPLWLYGFHNEFKTMNVQRHNDHSSHILSWLSNRVARYPDQSIVACFQLRIGPKPQYNLMTGPTHGFICASINREASAFSLPLQPSKTPGMSYHMKVAFDMLV